MRTTLDIPEDLIDEARRCAGTSSKTTAVVLALKEFVDRRRALQALERARGRVRFVADPNDVRHAASSATRARSRAAR
jgi:Arc/MetJ family transcription regulator